MDAQNDQTGGAGSFLPALLDIATYGAKSTIDGYNSKKYGIGYFNETVAYDREGNLVARAAQSSSPSTSAQLVSYFKGDSMLPTLLIVGAAAIVVALIVRR